MKQIAFVLALLAIACGGSTEPHVASVSGTWSGTIAGTQSQVLSMTLLDVSGQVIGSGSLSPTPSGSLGLAISGSFAAPTFTATMQSGTYPTIVFSGTLSGDEQAINGSVQGSGFTGQTVTLRKQSP